MSAVKVTRVAGKEVSKAKKEKKTVAKKPKSATVSAIMATAKSKVKQSKVTAIHVSTNKKTVLYHVSVPAGADQAAISETVQTAINEGGVLITTHDVNIIPYALK